MPFDIQAAVKEGYSLDEIISHLAQPRKFNVQGALQEGYSKEEIAQHLAESPSVINTQGTEKVPGIPGGVPPEAHPPRTPIQEHLSPSPGKYTISTPTGPAVYSENEFGSGPVGKAATFMNKTVGGGLSRISEGVERMAGEGVGAKAGGAKDIASGGLDVATPMFYRDLPDMPQQLYNAGKSVRQFFKTKPGVAIERALRPTPSNSDFTDNIESTIARIKKANGGAVPRTNEELIPMAQKGIDQAKAALEPYFLRAEAAGVKANGDPILAATHKAISESMLPDEIASKGQSVMDRAQMNFGRDFTPRELKDRLELLNARLSGYYDQSIAKQLAALSDVPDAVIKAQRDATANLLYHTLAPEEGGAGPRLIQSHMGDMIDIKNAAERARNRIIGEMPVSGGEQIKKALATPLRATVGGAVRTTIPNAGDIGTGQSNTLIKRAFKAVRQDPNVYPQPASSDYQFYPNPAPTTAKQLPVGKAPFSQGTVVPDIAGRPKGPGAPESRMGYMLPPGKPDVGEGVIQVPPAGASRQFPNQGKLYYNPTEQVPFSPRTAEAPADTSFVTGKGKAPTNLTNPEPPEGSGLVPVQIPPPKPPSGIKGNEPLGTFPSKTINMKPSSGGASPADIEGLKRVYRNNGMSEQEIADKISSMRTGDTTEFIPQFKKGGIITKPTLGLIGEAGPEARVPLTSAHPTTPESPQTIFLQMQQLESGDRRVVMIPKGTSSPKKPKGMKEYQDATGNRYIFNPSEISHREIDQAASSNNLPSILGAKNGGMGAPDKSRLGPGVKAVVGEDKNGREIQSTATDPQHLDKTISQTQKITPTSGKVQVKSPEDQIKQRQDDIGSPDPPEGKAVDKIRGSINVPLDEIGFKEADDLGKQFATKGGIHRIYSSPLVRAQQTAQGIAKHNPEVRVIITKNLRPWPLGGLEGTPTEQALPELKRLFLQAPAEIPRGIGKGSTEGGQSANRFKTRVLAEVRRLYNEHEQTAPNEVWDLGVHKSIINLIHAWSKKGANPSYDVDKNHFFAKGTDPASVYHLSNGGRTIQEVNMKDKSPLPKGGLLISRHGSTSFNAPSSHAHPGKSVS